MLRDLVENQALQCHHPDAENNSETQCSIEDKTYSLMNNCTDQQVQGGQCVCSKGSYGADCSLKVDSISSFNGNLGRNEWKHFIVDSSYRAIITSDHSINVYQREKDVPSSNLYDVVQSGTEISSMQHSKKMFLSLYNPVSEPTSVKLSVESDLVVSEASFWIFLVVVVILALFMSINIFYCFRLRGIQESIDETETALE